MWMLAAAAVAALAFATDAPQFVEAGAASGLKFQFQNSATSRKYLIETMGGGVAIFDYDNDGWPDVFFVNGAALGDPQPDNPPPDKSAPKFWNRLFRNNHDGSFTDVTGGVRLEGSRLRDGCRHRRLRQRRFYGSAGDHLRRRISLPQQRQRHIHRCNCQSGPADHRLDHRRRFLRLQPRWLRRSFRRPLHGLGFPKGGMFCGVAGPHGRAYCHPDEFKPVVELSVSQQLRWNVHGRERTERNCRRKGKRAAASPSAITTRMDGWISTSPTTPRHRCSSATTATERLRMSRWPPESRTRRTARCSPAWARFFRIWITRPARYPGNRAPVRILRAVSETPAKGNSNTRR